MLFENPVSFKNALTNYGIAYICHCWKNGRYFCKTHLATLVSTSSSLCMQTDLLLNNAFLGMCLTTQEA